MGLTRRAKAAGKSTAVRAEKAAAAKAAPKRKPASASAAAGTSPCLCTSPGGVILPQLYKVLHAAEPMSGQIIFFYREPDAAVCSSFTSLRAVNMQC